MKYKKELKYLNKEIDHLEFFHLHEELEFKINTLEIKFKETFYNLKLFKLDKYNEIILNLGKEKIISEYLLSRYEDLSKELKDVKLEMLSKLKKIFDLKAVSIASSSDFINIITKYKSKEELNDAHFTYSNILEKSIKKYISTLRQLKNICFTILKRKERRMMTKEEIELSMFKLKAERELNYVKEFLRSKRINITNIVIRGDTDGRYDRYKVYIDKEQYNEDLLNAIWYLLKVEFKKEFPLVIIESSEHYNLSPFSVDVTPKKDPNIYDMFKNKQTNKI